MDVRTLVGALIQEAEVAAISPAELKISAQISAQQRIDPASPQLSGSAAGVYPGSDVYHGSEPSASPSLLSRTGISAYTQLLSALAEGDAQQKSAAQLANNLASASASLKSAYVQAAAGLPAPLQGKDWGFSVFAGELVFTQGQDPLSAQDVIDLRTAFTAANVGLAAKQVAATITSINLMRKSGAELGPLVWGRLDVDETNFSDVVNLRTYVTATVPGGKYDARPPTPDSHPGIPALLGGMYLGDLISARPEILRANSAVKPPPEDPNAPDGEPVETSLGTLHGQCSCGQVRFTVQDAFDYAFYCHCSRCRLRTGSAFAAVAGIRIDKVEVFSGSEHLLIEGECPDGYGARCGRCYTFLFTAVRGRQHMNISLGVLLGTPSRLPDHHIFVRSKAPWYQITDGLPQYDELPSGQPGASASE